MKVVHVNVDVDPVGDCRVRKVLQWQRRKGIDATVVMSSLVQPTSKDAIEYPIRWIPLDQIHKLRQGVLDLEPDVIHCHELDALWALLSVWQCIPNMDVLGQEDLDRLTQVAMARGWCSIEKPTKSDGTPIRLIYEAHEYERGRLDFRPALQEDRVLKEQLCTKHVDEMIVVSPSIVEATKKDLGIRPHLIPNAPYVRHVEPELRRLVGAKPGQRVLVFCGNITKTRGLRLLAETMSYLGDEWVVALVGNLFYSGIGGQMAEDEELEALERVNAQHVDPRPYPHPGVGDSFLELISGADVAWSVGDMRVGNVRMWLPNKFFEYAWAGVPQVVNAQAQDVAQLCEDYGLGVPVDACGYDTAEAPAVADAVRRAAGLSMHDRGRFMRDWCWEKTGGAVIDEIYRL